jgi:hypothetical protein
MKLITTICAGISLLAAQVSFAQWTVVNSPTTDNLFGLYSIDANNVWAVGNNATVIKWNGSTWQTTGSIGVTQQRFTIWASSANNIYAGGAGTNNALIHYNGTSWNNITVASNWGSGSVRSIWGSSANSVWITGGPGTSGAARARRFNGSTWELKNAGLSATLSASIVYGIDAGNVWIAGSTGSAATTGIVYKWNEAGNTWNAVLGDGTNYPNLRGVYAADANNVWVVGGEGLFNPGRIFKWNGTSWTEQTLPASTPSLHAIHGSGTNNIWAVGYNGTVLKYDGTSWQTQASGTTLDLQSIRVTGTSDIWAVGNSASSSNALIIHSSQSTVLPLNWLKVEGIQEGPDVKLSWVTQEEKNTKLFEVQHQDADGNWKKIGELPASGFSTAAQHYSYRHGQARDGANYYRIMQTDRDGKAYYSKVIRVDKKSTVATIRIAPNPCTDFITLTGLQPDDRITIVNANGTTMKVNKRDAATINTAELLNGTYILTVYRNNERVHSSLVVKQ